jgi:hypothetical protein
VVKHSRSPGRDRVARRTCRSRRRETGGNVIRHCSADLRGALERRRMAPVTIRRIKRVVVIYMAEGARRRCRGHVCTGQGESSYAVIERRGSPACSRVAIRAIRRRESRSGRRVHRCSRLLPPR